MPWRFPRPSPGLPPMPSFDSALVALVVRPWSSGSMSSAAHQSSHRCSAGPSSAPRSVVRADAAATLLELAPRLRAMRGAPDRPPTVSVVIPVNAQADLEQVVGVLGDI